jgi:hypothetical protein
MLPRLTHALSIVLLVGAGSRALAAPDKVVEEDRVIAGGPSKSLEVRHLVLRGTNEQIGRALAEIAKERYGVRLEPARDPMQVRAQRQFLERNYPVLLDRMRGVAAAFGKSIDDDAWDFADALFRRPAGGLLHRAHAAVLNRERQKRREPRLRLHDRHP